MKIKRLLQFKQDDKIDIVISDKDYKKLAKRITDIRIGAYISAVSGSFLIGESSINKVLHDYIIRKQNE